MNLTEELKSIKNRSATKIPKDTALVMAKAKQDLKETGIENNALGIGDRLPEFSLPDAFNQRVDSSILLLRGPLVISFFRGHW